MYCSANILVFFCCCFCLVLRFLYIFLIKLVCQSCKRSHRRREEDFYLNVSRENILAGESVFTWLPYLWSTNEKVLTCAFQHSCVCRYCLSDGDRWASLRRTVNAHYPEIRGLIITRRSSAWGLTSYQFNPSLWQPNLIKRAGAWQVVFSSVQTNSTHTYTETCTKIKLPWPDHETMDLHFAQEQNQQGLREEEKRGRRR